MESLWTAFISVFHFHFGKLTLPCGNGGVMRDAASGERWFFRDLRRNLSADLMLPPAVFQDLSSGLASGRKMEELANFWHEEFDRK
jgi:hypothetical protein